MFSRFGNQITRSAFRALVTRQFTSSTAVVLSSTSPSQPPGTFLATDKNSKNNNWDNKKKSRPPPRRRKGGHNSRHKKKSPKKELPPLKLKDETLPCADHLDPKSEILPKGDWLHVIGTLPICSLEEVVSSFETYIRAESERGIVDLDALWNPVQDESVPTIDLDNYVNTNGKIIEAAHVVLSPFGRPNGWYLKFPNRSMVNAILTRHEEDPIRVAWKLVNVEEYKFSSQRAKTSDPAYANGLVVDNTMVRFENCPPSLTHENLRYFLSRFDLAPEGDTIIRWKGKTKDGKNSPLMFVVRFADAAWARAAIRELQSMNMDGRPIKLSAYPNQILFEKTES